MPPKRSRLPASRALLFQVISLLDALPAPEAPAAAITTPEAAVVFTPGAILESGSHRLDFVPKTGTSVRLRVLNENRRVSPAGSAGTRLTTTLRALSRDYAKWKIPLKTGQTAVFTPNKPVTNLFFVVANSRSAEADASHSLSVSATGVEYTARSTDNYWFFISHDPDKTTDTQVDLTLQLRQTLAFTKWVAVNGVDSLSDDPLQDADGDGYSNLMEYVLGSQPAEPSNVPALPYARVGNQLRMSYTVGSYVEGMNITPEASSSTTGAWGAVAPVSQTAVPEGTRYEAMSSGAGPRKFLRLKVRQQ